MPSDNTDADDETADAGVVTLDLSEGPSIDWFKRGRRRTGITSEEYTEMRTETDVVRIKTRVGWISIYEDACVEVEG